jgi:hypothetical protein
MLLFPVNRDDASVFESFSVILHSRDNRLLSTWL